MYDLISEHSLAWKKKSCKNTLVICHVPGMHELPSEVFVACPSGRRHHANLCCFVISSASERHFTWSQIRPVFQKTYEMVVGDVYGEAQMEGEECDV